MKKKFNDYDIFLRYKNYLIPTVGILTNKFGIKSIATVNGVTYLSRDFGTTLGNLYSLIYGEIPEKSVINPFYIRNKIAMSTIKNISKFAVLCPFSKEELNKNGLPIKKINVITNMLDPNFKVIKKNEKKDTDPVKILYIANLYYSKNIDLLINS